MNLIPITKEEFKICPHCQNLRDKGEYSYGADFSIIEHDDSFYIRKNNARNAYDLVFESEHIDNSCRIYFCPICGRELGQREKI